MHVPRWRGAHLLACLGMAAVLPSAPPRRADVDGHRHAAVAWVGAATGGAAWLALAARSTRQPDSRTLVELIWALTLTVVVALVVMLPSVAPAFTAREVARHYNRQGRLPATVWFYDERVGSFLFYLDAPLRRALTPEQVVRARPELLLALRHAPADTDIVVPIEEIKRLERRIPLCVTPVGARRSSPRVQERGLRGGAEGGRGTGGRAVSHGTVPGRAAACGRSARPWCDARPHNVGRELQSRPSPYGLSVSVCCVGPGRNGVGSPATHAPCASR